MTAPFGARYYDPSLGRWTQRDASAGHLANPKTFNRYTSAGCDPVNNVDPSGAICTIAVTALILGIAAGTLGLVALFTGGVVIYGVFFSAELIGKIAAIISFGGGIAGAEAFFAC